MSRLIEDLQAVAKGERPAEGDKLFGQGKSRTTDQETDGEETHETPSDRPFLPRPCSGLRWRAGRLRGGATRGGLGALELMTTVQRSFRAQMNRRISYRECPMLK